MGAAEAALELGQLHPEEFGSRAQEIQGGPQADHAGLTLDLDTETYKLLDAAMPLALPLALSQHSLVRPAQC